MGVTSVLSILSVPFIASAIPRGSASLQLLISDADAIIVADIKDGTIVNGTATVTLTVERVQKGDLRTGSTLQLMWVGPPGARPYSSKATLTWALFFLKKTAIGLWDVLPVLAGSSLEFRETYFGISNAEQPIAYRSQPGSSTFEKVFLELAWAVEQGPIGPRNLGFVDLGTLHERNPTSATASVLNAFSQKNDPRLVAMALRPLIRSGDLEALNRVEREQSSLLSTPFGKSISDSIMFGFRNASPSAVAALGRIGSAKSSSNDLKTACAGALAAMHTKDALPYLASFLDSTDLTQRTFAVGGLAMFANNVPIGRHEPASGNWKYRTDDTITHSAMDTQLIGKNESFYVGFWKAWWAMHRAELSGQ